MRFAIFYDEKLPYDGTRPDASALRTIGEYADMITLENFEEKLAAEYDCLINLHGQYFIKQAWPAIIEHLSAGRGLVNVGGGTPFAVPVRAQGGTVFIVEYPQTAYCRELYIEHGMQIDANKCLAPQINPDIPLLHGYERCFDEQKTVSLTVSFSPKRDDPVHPGTAGPVDAVIRALLYAHDSSGLRTAAPVVLIENTKSKYRGSRWVLVNQEPTPCFWERGGAELIGKLAAYTAAGTLDFFVRPNYASYYPGERATVLLQGQRFNGDSIDAVAAITIAKDGREVYSARIPFRLSDQMEYVSVPTNFPVEPGLYTITAEISVPGECARIYHNGFWGYDAALLKSGGGVSCGRDYFQMDGKPYPVVGMTYMDPDANRLFLIKPNAYNWDRDMALMGSQGVNMIRTGNWGYYRQIMCVDGLPSEEIMRAVDAFILTAASHKIPVIFTFFAFTPSLWEGENPFLDPRATEAQKRFIRSVVCRHKHTKWVLWDLINEPALCVNMTHWRPYPNYDRYEVEAWRAWLREKHGAIEDLQERWNMSPSELPAFESVELPQDRDMNKIVFFNEPFRALRVQDYVWFTQDMMNRWTKEMTDAIRDAAPGHLITVGQDEGLASQRPSPFFMEKYIDFTSNHTWWQMDDLFWDGVFAKTPNKPNLIEETGIMYAQDASSRPRRDEKDLRNILERKFAHAFISNSAGVIYWVWDIDKNLDSLMEVNNGIVRADGSHKLEGEVVIDFARFLSGISERFAGRALEDITVIFPYSNNFSVRDYADISTRRCARVLGYNMNTAFKAVGENNLDSLGEEKLIILPSPGTLSSAAWDRVLSAVHAGGTLLITGAFSYDEYWRVDASRAAALGLDTQIRGVCREERLSVGDVAYRCAFGGNSILWVDLEAEAGCANHALRTLKHGSGTVIWSPVPVEMGGNDEVIEAVYGAAMQAAGVKLDFEWIEGNDPGILGKKLIFASGVLYIFISESGRDTDAAIRDAASGKAYRFQIPSSRAMMFWTDSNGDVVKTYRNAAVDAR